MATFLPKRLKQSEVDATPKVDGQFIIVTDQGVNNKIYIDNENERVQVGGGAGTTSPNFSGSFSLNRKTDSNIGDYSSTHGVDCQATNLCSHADGYHSKADGEMSTAIGLRTYAYGNESYAEGYSTNKAFEKLSPSAILSPDAIVDTWDDTKDFLLAYGISSHAEGRDNLAIGKYSHAEGAKNLTFGECSHAEGQKTTAQGNVSHTEGYNTIADGDFSHAEGNETVAQGNQSHAEGYKTQALDGDGAHAEGVKSIAYGIASHAEGYNTNTGDNWSHSEGYNTTADGQISHAEGYSEIRLESYVANTKNKLKKLWIENSKKFTNAWANHSHAEGQDTLTMGVNSHAEGLQTVTVNDNSHSEGNNTTAYGRDSHAEGHSSNNMLELIEETKDIETLSEYDVSVLWNKNGFTASYGDYSHAEGLNCLAVGQSSHAEGNKNIANGASSHAEGNETVAQGISSHAEGNNTYALAYQHVQGHCNDTSLARSGVNYGTGEGTAFVIGNGMNSFASPSNAVRIDYNGKLWAKQSYSPTGADYAEYFEWLDGNKNNEERYGYFVTLDGDKIRKATDKDDYILGVISKNPSVLGNSDMEWSGKFLKDDFNSYLKKKETIVVDDEEVEIEFYVLSDDYDDTKEYVQRDNRPEWSAVGMLGVLPTLQDGTLKVNGYATVNKDGIATACEKKSENCWRVIKVKNDKVADIIFR